MATKANFTPDEWKIVLSSPMLVGMAVTLAEPSGIFGMMKEGMTSGMAVLKAKSDAGASELAKALVADMETSEGRSAAQDGLKSSLTGKTPDEIKQQVMAGVTWRWTNSRREGGGRCPRFQSVAQTCRRRGGGSSLRRRLPRLRWR